MSRIADLFEAESCAAEEADVTPDLPLSSNVKVTRGHDWSKVLQSV